MGSGSDGSAVRLAFPRCRRGHRKKRKEPSEPDLPHGEHDFTWPKQGEKTHSSQSWLIHTNGNTLVTTFHCHFQATVDLEEGCQYTPNEEPGYSCQKPHMASRQ